MEEFDIWQRWGLGLNDKEFANAFTALGVLAAAAARTRATGTLPASRKCSARPDLETALGKMLASLLSKARRSDRPIAWRYPIGHAAISHRTRRVKLSSIDPKALAQCWSNVLGSCSFNKMRFAVNGYPANEPIKVWFRLLLESDPGDQSAFLELAAPHEHLFWKWPLRLGYLPENGAESLVNGAVGYWPSNELARAARIDRDNANCDVLVFNGSTSKLMEALLDLTVPHKCNLIICQGELEDGSAAGTELLSVISARSRARGYVFLKPQTAAQDLSLALNKFVEHLSHNEPLDQAVCGAFAQDNKMDPAVFLSRDLADLRIEHLVEQTHIRLKAMETGTRLDIKPETLDRMGLSAKATGKDIGDARHLAKILSTSRSTISYQTESSGASGLAEINEAIKRAKPPQESRKAMAARPARRPHRKLKHAVKKGPQRFLKQKTLIKRGNQFVLERTALRQGIPTLIRIHIGYPDDVYVSLPVSFPEYKLPQNVDKWRLTVVFAEPNHVKVPMRKEIILPREGQSEECEFGFVPAQHATFEGRVTVLHRGRVLQTGVISAVVLPNEQTAPPPDARIDFTELSHIRSHMDDLEGRRQFDLAFVMNHTIDQRPLLTAIAANHAWLADISACQDITKDINFELTKVADLVQDYSGGLISDENVEMLVKLAKIGRQLYGKIVLGQIKQLGNQASFEKMEYIQIVSTKAEAMMPLEFIYSAVAPNDKAKLCPSMAAVVKEADKNKRMSNAKALIERTCQVVDKGETKCEYRTTEYVCPMGFWGTSKVIERHMATPLLAQPGKDFFLQSEATTARGELEITGTAIVAASEKVKQDMLSPVLSACADRLGSPPQEAKDWSDWVELIKTYKPHILVALPHTDGSGKNATLEINGKTLSSGQITEDHVHASDEKTYPLVALLGCDTTGTALDYGEYVSWFRWQGAALVISTIAKVFGGHAAAVAEQLIKGLKQKTGQQERIGEIIRTIKRQALLDGSLMALCIVAFGDADWKLN